MMYGQCNKDTTTGKIQNCDTPNEPPKQWHSNAKDYESTLKDLTDSCYDALPGKYIFK